MLFGLSMDYEVFLVSRMREWDNGATNEESVVLGLTKTGRLVTAAGFVMFAAFMGFVAGSIVGLQQFGFGLAAAILIDVTIDTRAPRAERHEAVREVELVDARRPGAGRPRRGRRRSKHRPALEPATTERTGAARWHDDRRIRS